MVYHIYRNGRRYLFEQVVFHFDTRNISAVDEVSDVFFGVVDVFVIVAFFVHVFIPRKQCSPGTVVFGSCESETVDTFCFAYNTFYGIDRSIVFTQSDKSKCIFGFGNEEISVENRSGNEGSIRFLSDFGDAVVKHDTDNLSHIVIDGPVDSSSHFAGHGVVFHIDIHPGVCGFFVFVECKDGLFVIGYGVVDTFCRVFGHFDFTEQFFDLSFHFVGIEVTDNDNTLLVGAIPFVIVVA